MEVLFTRKRKKHVLLVADREVDQIAEALGKHDSDLFTRRRQAARNKREVRHGIRSKLRRTVVCRLARASRKVRAHRQSTAKSARTRRTGTVAQVWNMAFANVEGEVLDSDLLLCHRANGRKPKHTGTLTTAAALRKTFQNYRCEGIVRITYVSFWAWR